MLPEIRKLPTVAVRDLVRRVWNVLGSGLDCRLSGAVTTRSAVLWYETPCCLVKTDRHLGGTCCRYTLHVIFDICRRPKFCVEWDAISVGGSYDNRHRSLV
jgi:hypothetical protein